MPTRMLPHRPISAPQSAQVTRLSSVEWSGTTNLLLPHLRYLRGSCACPPGSALAWHCVRFRSHDATSLAGEPASFQGLGPCLRGCCTSGGELLFGEAAGSVDFGHRHHTG